MKTVYVYESHNFGAIFLEDRELSKDELYCSECEDYDRLVAVCTTEEQLSELLNSLLQERDLMPCDNYDELIEKYSPKEDNDE